MERLASVEHTLLAIPRRKGRQPNAASDVLRAAGIKPIAVYTGYSGHAIQRFRGKIVQTWRLDSWHLAQ
jgi:hypothetical protein